MPTDLMTNVMFCNISYKTKGLNKKNRTIVRFFLILNVTEIIQPKFSCNLQ